MESPSEDSGESYELLELAIDAGFLDFGLMKTDPDLEILREQKRIQFAKEREYEWMKARNGVVIGYELALPKNYVAGQTYPCVVTFSPGGSASASVDWAIENVWGDSPSDRGWIALHLVGPE